MSRRKSVQARNQVEYIDSPSRNTQSEEIQSYLLPFKELSLAESPAINHDHDQPAGGVTDTPNKTPSRRSSRKRSPNKRYLANYVSPKSSGPRKTNQPANELDTSDSELNDLLAGEDASQEMLEMKVTATTLFEEQTDVAGNGVYVFRTPKKRGSMSALALASAQRTPSTSGALKSTNDRTPKARSARKDSKVVHSSSSDFSESESDYELSSDDEDDEDETESDDTSTDEVSAKQKLTSDASSRPKLAIPVPAKLPVPITPGGSRRRGNHGLTAKQPELQYIVKSDNYFSTHSGGKATTSGHSLSHLTTPWLPPNVVFKMMEEINASRPHNGAIQEQLDEYKQQFVNWMFLLDQGYSVLLYGLGSKRSLLQDFHRLRLADRPVLVVNGFFPGLSTKDVLDALVSDLLGMRQVTLRHHDAIDAIKRELSYQPKLHIFLLVHSLDGVAMRNERMQTMLCLLASIPNVHLIATIDHINAPLLWDAKKLRLFNFCWWDTTTMLPYTTETAFENSLLLQNAGAPVITAMKRVVSSLTTNARGIFMEVVKYQLANGGPDNPQYEGMLMKDLYWACREAFFVSSHTSLRIHLKEFTDHKILKIKRTIDGYENVLIPVPHGLLQRFANETAKS